MNKQACFTVAATFQSFSLRVFTLQAKKTFLRGNIKAVQVVVGWFFFLFLRSISAPGFYTFKNGTNLEFGLPVHREYDG